MVDECTVSSGTTSSVTEKLLQPGVAGYHQPAISAICDPRTARPEYAGAGGAKERSSSERSSPRQRAKCLATKAHSLPQCNINTTRNSTCPTWQPLGRQTAVAAAAANSDSGTANCRCRNRASKDVILETTCQRSRVATLVVLGMARCNLLGRSADGQIIAPLVVIATALPEMLFSKSVQQLCVVTTRRPIPICLC